MAWVEIGSQEKRRKEDGTEMGERVGPDRDLMEDNADAVGVQPRYSVERPNFPRSPDQEKNLGGTSL